jgi:hypothetical protein
MLSTKGFSEIGPLACATDLRHLCFECTPVSSQWAYYEIIGKYTNLFHLSDCWTNALQPLWIAGKVMSHYAEHGAIVETLIRIEQVTGWATAWRVEDLKGLWGNYDNEE